MTQCPINRQKPTQLLILGEYIIRATVRSQNKLPQFIKVLLNNLVI